MVEEIKVGGAWFSLCVLIMGILQGLSVKSVFNPTRLKKILLLDCRGEISFFVRVKYSIIKF